MAAAEESGDRATIVRAAGVLGLDDEGLAKAEAAGLVRVTAQRVDFRHPLVRSAAYRGAGFAEREHAHRALADVLTGASDADRRASHRAAATVGTDDDVAAESSRPPTARGSAAAIARRQPHSPAQPSLAPPTRSAGAASSPRPSKRAWPAGVTTPSRWPSAPSWSATSRSAARRLHGCAGSPSCSAGHRPGTPDLPRRRAELGDGETEKALEMLVYAAESASLAGDAGGMRAVSQAASKLSVGQDERASFLLLFLSGWARSARETPPAPRCSKRPSAR